MDIFSNPNFTVRVHKLDIEQRLHSLQAELDDLRTRVEINDVLHRYCRAADRCDEALMLTCYHHDAVDDHGFFSGLARDFVPLVIAELRKLALSVHSISNTLIDRDGERAFVESHYAVIHRIPHWLGYTDFYHHGRYLDVFERKAGQWRISTRIIVQDGERWFQTANLSPLLNSKPNTPPQGSQSLRSDPVHFRFEIGMLVKPRPHVPNLWSGFKRLALAPLLLVRLVLVVLAAARSVKSKQ